MDSTTLPSSMAKDSPTLHIAMFPWLAFGHMVPYLELAKLIAQKGHKVSFISTPKNIDRLPKELPPNLLSLINFVKLPLPNVDNNLPQHAEATNDIPFNKVMYLKKAYDGLQEPMTRFLQNSDPDWILYDFASYWVGPIASKLGVSCAFFSILIPAMLAFVGPPSVLDGEEEYRTKIEDFTVSPKWVKFPSSVAYKYHEIAKLFESDVESDVSGVSTLQRFARCIRGCDIVAVRGCAEFDRQWFQVLDEIYEKPVYPVGQLPTTEYDSNNNNDMWLPIKGWLDKQNKGSVVYVAFGSEAKPSQEELTEIAFGLELSGLPFFWVLRTRRGVDDNDVIKLPEGFEDRTKGRGVVCTSWAPQLKIIAHDSVAGFLTHSGWSSVVEALNVERALILLTFLADQGINARVLEEKKIAYSIPRNERDGSFTRDSVAESLRLVMLEEEGKIYRDKAKEMKKLFGDKDRQDRYVDNLLDYLRTHKCIKAAKANGVEKS